VSTTPEVAAGGEVTPGAPAPRLARSTKPQQRRAVLALAVIVVALAFLVVKGLTGALNYYDTVDEALHHRGLLGTTTHATTQLVQLRESEAPRVLDDDHRGIGHVNTDLDDDRRHEDVEFTRAELGHHLFLLLK
jgi:hypothetical protein